MKIVLSAILLVFISVLLLGFGLLMRDNKRFGKHEVGHNKHMRELGISCTRCSELKRFNELKKKKQINANELKIALD